MTMESLTFVAKFDEKAVCLKSLFVGWKCLNLPYEN
jgi:hypothetical protein